MPKPKYTIGAVPRQKVVAKGIKVTYYLNRGKKVDTVDHSDPIQRWVVWYSNTAQKHEGAPASYVVPKNRTQRDDFSHTWKYEGRHQVQLFLQTGSGAKESDFKKGPSFYQEVQPVKDILALRKSDWQHPRRMISFAEKYKTYLENLEKKAPTTDGFAKARQLEELEKYYQYHTWLKFLLAGYEDLKDDEFLPVYARFHEKQSQKTIDLNVFLVDREDRWELVDWTAPRNPRKWGQPVRQRMHMSLMTQAWESSNDYPPGHLRYFISHRVLQGRNTDVKGLFETGKASVWDKIAEFLGWASAAAAIAAITVGVLVPGSAWVTGLIWTSLLSSSTQAVINIGVRLGRRGSHWYEDLFDSLTILGNLFAAGAIWKQGATLLAQPARQKRAMKYMFYGQVATDGFQGILITVESYRELELLMQDGKKTPEERTKQARELLRSWGLNMTILFAGLYAGKNELDELTQAGISAEELKRRLSKLADPDETIDLTKPPSIEGHTKDGKVTTRSRDVQPGRPGTSSQPSTFKSKFPEDDSIWRTRKVDDPEEILLQRKFPGHEGDPAMDLWFHASTTHPPGYIHVELIMTYQTVGGKKIYTPELRAKELYPMMFEHFENAAKKTGKPIKGIKGEFAFDNFEKIQEAIANNPSLVVQRLPSGQLILKAEALTHAKTWEYWQAYADAYGYTLKPLRDVVLDPADEMVYWMFRVSKKN